MERVDFYRVINTLDFYVRAEGIEDLTCQPKILGALFEEYIIAEEEPEYNYDPGQASRIYAGVDPVGPGERKFYREEENLEALAWSIVYNFFEKMAYPHLVVRKLRQHMIWDDELRACLGDAFVAKDTFPTLYDEALHLARIIQFSISRPFIKREPGTGKLMLPNGYVPQVAYEALRTRIPKPCTYFQGREAEIKSLHDALGKNNMVCLRGIVGIGTSQLVYKYAEICGHVDGYKDAYNRILYVDYSGDLRTDLLQLDNSLPAMRQNSEARITEIEYLLGNLQSDTLLIIDNLHTTIVKERYIDKVKEFGCKVLIVSQSCFEDLPTVELQEIEKIEDLIRIIGIVSKNEQRDPDVLTQIINAVKRHTMAVVLIAKLLKQGRIKEKELLRKFRLQKIKIDLKDYFLFRHGKKSEKKTFYGHMRMLFSLFKLTPEEAAVMQNMVLTPSKGIEKFLFLDLVEDDSMNTVNDLIELGLIQELESDTLSLHPLIKEMSHAEFKPSTQKCHAMVENVHTFCRTEDDHPWLHTLFEVVIEMIEWAEKDSIDPYMCMIEDVFACMHRYNYRAGMEKILDEMAQLLEDEHVGYEADRALLLDYGAYLVSDTYRQIERRKMALAILPLNTVRNVNMASNINHNIAFGYYSCGEIRLAKEYLAVAIRLMNECGKGNSYDAYRQLELMCLLLKKSGEKDEAEKLENFMQSLPDHSMHEGGVCTYIPVDDYTNMNG